jgi:hypothetical protein
MFAFPEQVNLWQTIRKNPLLWFGILLIIVHSATFYSQKQTERGIQNAKNKYREWWINGGQMALASRGIDVSDNSYEAFEQEYLQKYLNKKIRYTLNFVPATDTPFNGLPVGYYNPIGLAWRFLFGFMYTLPLGLECTGPLGVPWGLG